MLKHIASLYIEISSGRYEIKQARLLPVISWGYFPASAGVLITNYLIIHGTVMRSASAMGVASAVMLFLTEQCNAFATNREDVTGMQPLPG
jgi:hypothetical protein